jgi:NADH:ubiquinone oxidoreductase subunit 4 (subunit M)
MWLYNRLFFGTLKINYGFYYTDLFLREFYLFAYLLVIMFFLGLNSNFVLNIVLINIEQSLLFTGY